MKFTPALLVCLIFTGLFYTNTNAHVTEVSGGISAQLHIDPGDSPIVGKPAKLFFELHDSLSHFSLSQCECYVTIEEKGKPENTMLNERLPEYGFIEFIFPHKGIYTITFSGMPEDDHGSLHFGFSFDVRVERESGDDALTSLTKQGWNGFIGYMTGNSHHGIAHGVYVGLIVLAMSISLVVIARDGRVKVR